MIFSLANVIEVLIIYQSLVFVLFLFFNKQSKPFFIKTLMAICVLIILHFSYMLIEEKLTEKPYFLGPFFGLLYGPLYYIYAKSLMVKKMKIKDYALHFILPFMALPIMFLFGRALENTMAVIGLFVTLHFISYLVGSLRAIFSFRRQLHDEMASFQNINLKWLEIIIYIQLLTLLVTLVESYFQSKTSSDVLVVVIFVLVLVIINCFYYLGLKQVRLYKGLSIEGHRKNTVEYSISEEAFKNYASKLTNFINQEKPYLNYDMSLDDLSEKLNISKRNLSHVINKEFKMNFYDFINHFRILKAKEDLMHSTKAIKEVMYDSGFANKSSFNAIFKKQTGLTPTQFRQKHKS